MGSLDSNSVWQYDGNDNVTPLAAFMNLGQGSISDALADLRSDFTVTDTGWLNIPPASGMTGSFQGRRIGDTVYLRGDSAPGLRWDTTSKTLVSNLQSVLQPSAGFHGVATTTLPVGDLFYHVIVSGATITARASRVTTSDPGASVALNLTYLAS